MAKNDKIEVVTDDNIYLFHDVEKYINYIQKHIDLIIQDYNLPDDFSPNQFTCISSMICNRVYKKNICLLLDNPNIKRYNPYKVYICFKVYLFICQKYKMIPSLYNFVKYSGIDEDIIYIWDNDIKSNNNIFIVNDFNYNIALNNGLLNLDININNASYNNDKLDNRLTLARVAILKDIYISSENDLQSLLLDKSINPIKPLSILNYKHGWADLKNRNIEQSAQIASADLPMLPTFSNQSTE